MIQCPSNSSTSLYTNNTPRSQSGTNRKTFETNWTIGGNILENQFQKKKKTFYDKLSTKPTPGI